MDLRGEATEHPLSDLSWRSMGEADLDAVTAIAAVGFPDHFEDRACFENRLALHPAGCFVLDGTAGAAGYLIAYPWTADAAPELNTRIGAIPHDAALMYLHDLALSPNARGKRYTAEIVERLAEQARSAGWRTLALVAVNDAAGFWAHHGFRARETPSLVAKMASYGPGALYMVRDL